MIEMGKGRGDHGAEVENDVETDWVYDMDHGIVYMCTYRVQSEDDTP